MSSHLDLTLGQDSDSFQGLIKFFPRTIMDINYFSVVGCNPMWLLQNFFQETFITSGYKFPRYSRTFFHFQGLPSPGKYYTKIQVLSWISRTHMNPALYLNETSLVHLCRFKVLRRESTVDLHVCNVSTITSNY